jgi:hypothetical protein
MRFGTAPAAEESEKARCSSAAFPKLFMFREVEMQVSLVTVLLPELYSTSLFTTGYRRLAEGGQEAFWMKGGF